MVADSDELAPLLPHLDYLEGIAKPSVEIRLAEDESAKTTGSRFGGLPAVPPGFRWPKYAHGQFRFLGQINCAEIEAGASLLPDAGILSFFYAVDENGECVWAENDYVTAYFWPDPAQLKELAPARSAGPATDSVAVQLERGLHLPRHYELRDDWPFDEDSEEIDLVVYGLAENQADDYLLGYPSYCTLGEDPTPGEDWIALLTVASNEDLNWCWQDGDKLMVFIQKDKLKTRDFSKLYCIAG